MTVGEVLNAIREVAEKTSDAKPKSGFDPDKRIDVRGAPKEDRGKAFDPDKRVDAGASLDTSRNTAFNPDKRIEPQVANVDGARIERDDAGKPYKIDGKMMPNCRYEVNGYSYKTDKLGRRVSVEGNLHVKHHEGRLPIKASKEDVGGKEHRESDDVAHLAGDQFGGSNRVENLVSMDRKLNQVDFNRLEGKFAKALKDGSEVYYKMDVKYRGDSLRPSKFIVNYAIDGEKGRRVFSNETGGAR